MSSKKGTRKELLKIGSSKGQKKINFGKKSKKEESCRKVSYFRLLYSIFYSEVKSVPVK